MLLNMSLFKQDTTGVFQQKPKVIVNNVRKSLISILMNGFNIFEGMKGNFLCEGVEIANLSETKRGTKCLKIK